MDEAAIVRYIADSFEGIETETATDNTFFFYGPERMMPLATLVTNDAYDTFSDLNRPSVYRLNMGISPATYRALFGAQADAAAVGGHDFTAPDRVMPHPVYAQMSWVCVLNPSAATFEAEVRPLLAEAYARAARIQTRRAARG